MVSKLFLALALATSTQRVEPPKQPATADNKETQKQDASGRLNLALKFGYTMRDNKPYQERRASLTIDGYLVEIQFRREDSERDLGQETSYVSGLVFSGERRSRIFQGNIVFGYAFYENERRFLNTRVYSQVMGGLQLTKNTLELEKERIPTDPELDLLLGTGARIEFSHPINSWTKIFFLRNLEFGLGALVEYLSGQLEISKPESKFYYGGYLSLGISKRGQ